MTARLLQAVGWLVVILTFAPLAHAAAPRATKRVLLLHHVGTSWQMRTQFASALYDTMRATDDVRIELNEETIQPDPSSPEPTEYMARYLASKYAGRTIDVIVAYGTHAVAFAREHRALLGRPPIVAAVTPNVALDPADGIVGLHTGGWVDGTVQLARALRPDTCCVVVVDGARGNSGSVEDEVRRQWTANPHPVSLIYLRDLPLDDLLKRVADLPEQSIIFYIRQTMRSAAEDIDWTESLEQILAVARVPTFSHLEEFVGVGVVGGALWRYQDDARRMANMALRLIRGTNPREIATERSTYPATVDARQLARWSIPESRVPAGATVVNRPSSVADRYRGYIIGGVTLATAQIALVVGLLIQRSRRRKAERLARESREEVARLTRISAIGELAASLAHELNQPLSAILSNARAATNLLARQQQPSSEVDEILRDIMEDDKRAGEVIKRMRDLVGKHVTNRTLVDVHDMLATVVKLVSSDAIIRQVTITLDLAPGPVMVTGDQVQLQQVILNLLLNALEGTSSSEVVVRDIVVSTTLSDHHTAHIVVRDDGPGLAPGAEAHVFEPSYTMTANGMAMGLAVARSLVESHDGRIWAAPAPVRGTEFHVTLPRRLDTGADTADRRSA